MSLQDEIDDIAATYAADTGHMSGDCEGLLNYIAEEARGEPALRSLIEKW